MTPIAQRLQSYLQYRGLNTTAFSKQLNHRSCEKIARLFRISGAKPSIDILEDIACCFPELSLRWLLTGQGHMIEHSEKTEELIEGNVTTISNERQHLEITYSQLECSPTSAN